MESTSAEERSEIELKSEFEKEFVEKAYKVGASSQARVTILLDEQDKLPVINKNDEELIVDLTNEGRKHIVTDFAHGNEPYRGAVDTAITVNDILSSHGKARAPIIVPLIYPGKQEKILTEEFPEHIDEIFLVDELGESYREILFQNGRYDQHLASIADNQERLQDKIWETLAKNFEAKSLASGEVREFNGRDTAFGINYGSRFVTTEQTYFAFPVLLSRLLEYVKNDETLLGLIQNSKHPFDLSKLEKVQRIAEDLEKRYVGTFIPEIHTFSHDESYDSKGQIMTPPLRHPGNSPQEIDEKAVYVMASGTGSQTETVFKSAQELGLKIYRNPFVKMEFGTAALPDVIYHPRIVAMVGRMGWGTGWLCQQAEKPFIVPGYEPPDDPEIYYNIKTLTDKKLGKVFDSQTNIIQEAISLTGDIKELNENYKIKYGTTDGIQVVAKNIVSSVQERMLQDAKKHTNGDKNAQ